MTNLLIAGLGGLFFILTTGCGQVKFANSKATAPSQSPSPTPPSTQGARDVIYNGVAQAPNSKLDLLLIVDDSNSMLPENQKLASRLADFVNRLQSSSLDWQMCVTVTRPLMVNGNPAWGASIAWSNYTPGSGIPQWVLKSSPNLATIFTNTINNIGAGWVGTDDERGIKSAWWHVYNGDLRYGNNSKCYRSDAALAMILISDEDVRSVGSNRADEFYPAEFKELENDDLPQSLKNQVKEVFGPQKRWTFNSIIVTPNDSACLAAQDAGGAKSHFGLKYKELSDLSGGGVASICAENYSTNLNLFIDRIQDSIASIPLECTPVNSSVEAQVTPTVTGLSSEVQGATITFTPAIPSGRSVSLKYKCPR
jgi:hypothetical protein